MALNAFRNSVILTAVSMLLCPCASIADDAEQKPVAPSANDASTADSTRATMDVKPAFFTPTQAYMNYHKRVHSQSLEDLSQLLATTPKVPPKGDQGSILEGVVVKHMSPEKLRITSEKIDGERATLTAIGLSAMPGGAPGSIGKIVMALDSGQWKLLSETWTGKSGGGQYSVSHGSEIPTKGAPTSPTQVWCDSAAVAAFPQKPAYGALRGQPFRVTRAVYSTFIGRLDLKQGADDFFPDQEVSIMTFEQSSPAGHSFIVSSKSDDFKDPQINILWKKGEKTSSASYSGRERYGMRLQFSQMKNGMVPGYIVLRLPDKSYVEGYFYAALK
jgi:hypothetical protein